MSILKQNLDKINYLEQDLKERLLEQEDLYTYSVDKTDPLKLNVKELKTSKLLFKDPLNDLVNSLNFFNPKYQLYPIIYLFGIHNSVLFQTLFKNKTHKIFVIIEPNLALLKLFLSTINLGDEAYKVLVIDPATLSLYNIRKFLEDNKVTPCLKCYFLHVNSSYYYEKYEDLLLNTSELFSTSVYNQLLEHGNDSIDAMMGIRHSIYSLPMMLTHPSFYELFFARSAAVNKQAKKDFILVSTGPSLKKQLPLLKSVQDKACIISADSAYPILVKAGIIPDYVLCLERTAKTAELFTQSFGELDKDITFITVSLVHPNFFKLIGKRNYMLVFRPLPFSKSMKLSSYYSLGAFSSVAHMGVELAFELGAKKVVLIGQDLSYAKDETSHCEGYIHGSDYEKPGKFGYTLSKVEGYGGVGEVTTHTIWLLFKNQLEILFDKYKHSIEFINSTQGGARIKFCKEESFESVCKTLTKPKPYFKPLGKKTFKTTLKESKIARNSLKSMKKDAKDLLASYENLEKSLGKMGFSKGDFKDSLLINFKTLEEKAKQEFASPSLEEIISLDLKSFDKAAKLCDDFKLKYYKKDKAYAEILSPIFIHLELNLTKLLATNVPQSMQGLKAQLLINYQFSSLYRVCVQIKAFLRMLDNGNLYKNTLKQINSLIHLTNKQLLKSKKPRFKRCHKKAKG